MTHTMLPAGSVGLSDFIPLHYLVKPMQACHAFVTLKLLLNWLHTTIYITQMQCHCAYNATVVLHERIDWFIKCASSCKVQ